MGLILPLWPQAVLQGGLRYWGSPSPSTQTGHGPPAAALTLSLATPLLGSPSVPSLRSISLAAREVVGGGEHRDRTRTRQADSCRQFPRLCQGAVTSAPVLRKEGAMTRKQRVRVVVQLWTGHHPMGSQAVLATLAPAAPEPHTAHNFSFPGGQPGCISKAKVRYTLED